MDEISHLEDQRPMDDGLVVDDGILLFRDSFVMIGMKLMGFE